MTFKSSNEDTSYCAIERRTTRSGLKRRTNNNTLPHRPRSLKKGGDDGREGKKETKSSPLKKVGLTPCPTRTALITHTRKKGNFQTKHELKKSANTHIHQTYTGGWQYNHHRNTTQYQRNGTRHMGKDDTDY